MPEKRLQRCREAYQKSLKEQYAWIGYGLRPGGTIGPVEQLSELVEMQRQIDEDVRRVARIF